MPLYNSNTVSGLARRIKAFLGARVGAPRSEVVEAETLRKKLHEQAGRLDRLRDREQKRRRQVESLREKLANKNRKIKRLERSAETMAEQLAKKEEQLWQAPIQPRAKARRIARLENRLSRESPATWNETNSRNRGHSTLLVSFCNVRDENKPVLAAVDLRADEPPPRVRWIGLKADTYLRGATGMCFWNDLLCVAHQGNPDIPQGFVLLDPSSDFELVHEGFLPPATGVHSVCSRDGALYFVADRKDSVYQATLDERTGEWICSSYWTFPGSSGQQDENHLNAIERVEGDLHVSGFGKKKSGAQPGWRSTTEGFVYNIDREEYAMEGIYHPHSLLEDSGLLWSCESSNKKVLSSAGYERTFSSGYIRGLAISEDQFYVGSSKRRKVSESTGAKNPWVLGELEGSCCIYTFSRETSDSPEMLVDFSGVRNEIYEMVLI